MLLASQIWPWRQAVTQSLRCAWLMSCVCVVGADALDGLLQLHVTHQEAHSLDCSSRVYYQLCLSGYATHGVLHVQIHLPANTSHLVIHEILNAMFISLKAAVVQC